MGLWKKWKQARREREEQRQREREELRQAWRDLKEVAPRSLEKAQNRFQEARRQFYSAEWTPETARLELNKISRALKRFGARQE